MKDELKAALIYAASTASRAEIEGMNAENQHRMICDNQISYGVEAFSDIGDKLKSEVKRIVGQNMTRAASEILAERKRQIESKGYKPEYDDNLNEMELSRAAAAYAVSESCALEDNWYIVGKLWPFQPSEYKQKSRRQNLVRAGALIIAEIERLDRLATKESK